MGQDSQGHRRSEKLDLPGGETFIGRCILLLGFLPSNRSVCVLGNDKKSLVDEKGALR